MEIVESKQGLLKLNYVQGDIWWRLYWRVFVARIWTKPDLPTSMNQSAKK